MTVKQLLERMEGVNDRYLLEAEELMGYTEEPHGARKRHAPLRRILLIAAALVGLLTLSAAAISGNWFGLRDMLLPQKQEIRLSLEPGETQQQTQTVDMISLAGYGDTPESRANAEWQAFLDSYDQDGAILESVGNSIFGAGTSYIHYQVYTQEMADKLDEIIAKYNLKLHTVMIDDLYTDEALCDQVGGDFLGENRAYSSYMYEDGSFKFDGELELPDYGLLDYQFQRCVRGSFSELTLNIRDIHDYTEWSYTTESGIPALLALAPHKALIVVDLPDSFVTINVLAGTGTPVSDIFSNGPLTAVDLERFADSFNFSVLTPARPADLSLARPTLEDALGKPTAEEFYRISGIEEAEAQAFYAELLRDIENGDRMAVAERILYPASVTHWQASEAGTYLVENAVGSAEEFLLYYDDIFTESLWWDCIMANRYDLGRSDLIPDNGMVGAAGGVIWFMETPDGMRVVTVQNNEDNSVRMTEPGITSGPGSVAEAVYADAREAYANVLEDLLYRHILPDGTACEPYEEMEVNSFAVQDVNGDGAEELVLLFRNTYSAEQAAYVLAFDEPAGTLRTELLEYPMLTFYENGIITAGWSHNQGKAGEALWPYTLYRYDAGQQVYQAVAMVDAWSKNAVADSFPEEVDQSGTGVVYYIMKDGYDLSNPRDAADYIAWRESLLAGSAELEVTYLPLTRENIQSFKNS